MKKINILLMAAGVFSLSGCIDETLPTDYVLSTQIEQSESALQGMVNGIYTTMAGYSNDDGGIETISYGSLRSMFEHATTPLVCTGYAGYNTMAAWTRGQVQALTSNRGKYPSYVYYGYIKGVNDIIGMIDPETTDATRKGYLGIAYAYRALYYTDFVQVMEYKAPTDTRYTFVQPENDITNLGVPIVTESTTSEELANNPRATVDDVYDLILSDLAKAETYLTGYNRTDKIEPNLACVYAMYARAYTNIASRVNTSVKYKDEAQYWQKAGEYAQKAISVSGCTPLTEDEWTDPENGFNNRNSQNSWLWATTISESNTTASSSGSFVLAMLMGTETNFSAYGWRVGRSLDRKMYEKLSDNDFRKKSWLAPNFFYESTNQVEGEPYLVEKDENGSLINNKWFTGATGSSTTNQDNWSDEYSGFGPDKYQYKLNSSASWIRSRIGVANGYVGIPWIYVNIKFRPHNGVYDNYTLGGATDYPIIRVEEMYFLEAEAALHTSGVSSAKTILQDLIKTRNPDYTCTATTSDEFMKEYNFQKQIEFWGEGINYFDAKRLELGIHRYYIGTNCNNMYQALDMNGIFCGWTPGWNQAELNGNPAIYHYNNPYTNYQTLTSVSSNAELQANFGATLDLDD